MSPPDLEDDLEDDLGDDLADDDLADERRMIGWSRHTRMTIARKTVCKEQ
jgi:hypothetical protein